MAIDAVTSFNYHIALTIIFASPHTNAYDEAKDRIPRISSIIERIPPPPRFFHTVSGLVVAALVRH